MKRVLWWLIAGSRGGESRAKIISTLKDRPSNANQLAEALNMDYKTIRHHLDVLEENMIIAPQGDVYGAVYFLTAEMENNYGLFEEIWAKIGKKQKRNEAL